MKSILRKECFGGILYVATINQAFYINEYTYNFMVNIKLNGIHSDKYTTEEKQLVNKLESLSIIKEDKLCIEIIDNSITNNALSFPSKIFISITEFCNLKCQHCFGKYGKSNHMNFELFKKIIDECHQYGVFEINITGGEPFLHPQITQFLEYAYNKNLNISISTNGTVLNNQLISVLNKIKTKLIRISISIDGPKDFHNNFRGANSFDKTIENISILKKIGIKTTINYVINRKNISLITDFLKCMKNYNFTNLSFSMIKCTGLAKENNLIINNQEYLALYSNLLNELKDFSTETNSSQFLFGKLISPKGIITSTDDTNALKLLNSNYCGAGVINCSISSCGDVLPCSFLLDYIKSSNYNVENVNSTSLKYIWDNNISFLKFRQEKPNLKCLSCDLYKNKTCYGGCPANIFGLTNSTSGINPYCKNKEVTYAVY